MGVTPGEHDVRMNDPEISPVRFIGCGEPEPGDWWCPTCGAYTPHPFRAGRKRVYCSNACKQRAYRWRCNRGIRLLVTPWTPASRSETGARAHAVRHADDRVAQPTDQRGRHVAVCGAFARAVVKRPTWHVEYVPGGSRSCRACTRLIGADPQWFEEYPLLDLDERGYRCVYRPPAERQRRWSARDRSGRGKEIFEEAHEELGRVASAGERHDQLASVLLELGAPRQPLEARLL